MTYLDMLNLSALRGANTARIPQFNNGKGLPAHRETDGSDWSPGDWLNAIVGELGETANVLKKVLRGDFSLEEMRPEIGKELADVVTYLDILGLQLKLPLALQQVDYSQLQEKPQSHLMMKLTYHVGQVAHFLLELEESHDENLPFLDQSMAWVLTYLNAVAIQSGVKLGEATMNKFNEVSVRVGSTIRLTPDTWLDIA